MGNAQSRVRDTIIDYLRELILGGELTPGDVLHESELTKRFGTSRSPVREALLHLEQEQLVEIIPKKGTVVTGIEAEQLTQALFIRNSLETSNIQMLCKSITAEQISILRENVAEQHAALEANEYTPIYNSFDNFHFLLCDFNKLPRAWEIVRKEKISLDRLHALTKNHMPRLHILYQQHVDIVNALENRDVMQCTHLIQSHADIDFEAQSLLSSSLKEAWQKTKEREKRSNHENN